MGGHLPLVQAYSELRSDIAILTKKIFFNEVTKNCGIGTSRALPPQKQLIMWQTVRINFPGTLEHSKKFTPNKGELSEERSCWNCNKRRFRVFEIACFLPLLPIHQIGSSCEDANLHSW